MFKPNSEHIEELIRAKEICESLIDEIQDNDCLFLIDRARLNSAAAAIDAVLDNFDKTIEALTP